jgi:hypothetical protein
MEIDEEATSEVLLAGTEHNRLLMAVSRVTVSGPTRHESPVSFMIPSVRASELNPGEPDKEVVCTLRSQQTK